MGTLRDEVYENLDYLSQLTEVVISPLNEALSQTPDKLELTFEQVNKHKTRHWGAHSFELSVSEILLGCLPQSDWPYIQDIKQHFKLEVSEDFEIDLANRTMIGQIVLVKTAQHIDDKQILEIALIKSRGNLYPCDWPKKRLREKIATVLNTLTPESGTQWAKNLEGSVSHSGDKTIRKTLSEVILENKWRVRDVNVILKIGQWINSYLQDETEQDLGLVNLTKLKIMIDKDLPIYSVDEVKNADSI